MATELQYLYFQSIYEAENQRYASLEARSRLYLTLQTFYIGAVAFKFSDVMALNAAFRVPAVLYIGAGVLLLFGLFLTVLAARIRTYEAPSNLRTIVESFGTSPQRDSEFMDCRLADFVVATERNSAVNERVASLLSGTSFLLATAVLLHFTTFLWGYITLINQ
jgi:hypothetical protein